VVKLTEESEFELIFFGVKEAAAVSDGVVLLVEDEDHERGMIRG